MSNKKARELGATLYAEMSIISDLYAGDNGMVEAAEREYVDALFEHAMTDFTADDIYVFELDHPNLAAAIKQEAEREDVEYEKCVFRIVKGFYDNAFQTILDSRDNDM